MQKSKTTRVGRLIGEHMIHIQESLCSPTYFGSLNFSSSARLSYRCMMGNPNDLAAGSYPSLVTLCFSLVLVYILTTACYRLYFHPLALFPGPFWARLTVIPSWWHTRTGDRHIWMHSLQEKYGMVRRPTLIGALAHSHQAQNFGTAQTALCSTPRLPSRRYSGRKAT